MKPPLFSDAYRSWGNHRPYRHLVYEGLADDGTLEGFLRDAPGPLLAFGNGRSYGDVCLNENHALIPTHRLNRILRYDAALGTVYCEAGVTFEKIIRHVANEGWFIPVVPSTKFLTVGGAVANDVHGRDQVRRGNFGHHLLALELIRSDGKRYRCSDTENAELFRATIGGLGLTGFIARVEFRLKPIPSPYLRTRLIPFDRLADGLELLARARGNFEYVTAWVDGASGGKAFGSGHLFLADHAEAIGETHSPEPRREKISVPDWPRLAALLVNRYSLSAFNRFYSAFKKARPASCLETGESALFQLDRVANWNRLYGKGGILQYQFALPRQNEGDVVRIFDVIRRHGLPPFFSILKPFGKHVPRGLLSFPTEGITGALDFPARYPLAPLFAELNEIVASAGGRLYPAKDRGMSAELFWETYPHLPEFLRWVDPKFGSNFWRRVRPSFANHTTAHSRVGRDLGDFGGDGQDLFKTGLVFPPGGPQPRAARATQPNA